MNSPRDCYKTLRLEITMSSVKATFTFEILSYSRQLRRVVASQD